MRISRDAMLMEMAIIAAKRSTCLRRQVGAVIAFEGRILTLGYAGSPPGMPHCEDVGCLIGPHGGCVRTQHAEINAITFAARKGISLEGSSLYTTLSPCLHCAKAIISAGIISVMYLEKYWITEGIDLLAEAKITVTHAEKL